MPDNEFIPTPPISLFFRAQADEKNTLISTALHNLHNEAEHAIALQKRAFKEVKKQWKTLIEGLEKS